MLIIYKALPSPYSRIVRQLPQPLSGKYEMSVKSACNWYAIDASYFWCSVKDFFNWSEWVREEKERERDRGWAKLNNLVKHLYIPFFSSSPAIFIFRLKRVSERGEREICYKQWWAKYYNSSMFYISDVLLSYFSIEEWVRERERDRGWAKAGFIVRAPQNHSPTPPQLTTSVEVLPWKYLILKIFPENI